MDSTPTLLWEATAKLDWAFALANYAKKLAEGYAQTSLEVEKGNVLSIEPAGEGNMVVTGSTYNLVLRTKPLPIELPLVIGSVIHSLRSSLDTALSTLMTLAKGKDDARTNFPMHLTERELRNSFGSSERKCPDCGKSRPSKGINAPIREHLPDFETLVMETFKPWKDGNPLLWGLGKVDNIHKHRMLMPTFSETSWKGTLEATFPDGAHQVFKDCTWRIGPAQAVTVIEGAISIDFDDPGRCSIKFIFGGVSPFSDLDVFETLKECISLVDGIIKTLETHFKRGESTT